MISMESEFGIPAVAVHVQVFSRLVESVARAQGMPRARQAFVPVPMFNQPPAVLRGYVEGDDPVHGAPFMERVFDLLTRPLSDEDLRGSGWDRSTPRLLEPDTEENLHEFFRENHWTDYLPIVLPTDERVEAMLAGTSRAPDEIVGKTRPTIGMEYWTYDVEKVAVNAVMAGAAPEQHVLDGQHGRGQRPDPQRDPDELGDRGDGAVQPRELGDRPRLRPSVAEPPGRLG